jgi:hypothetical protein
MSNFATHDVPRREEHNTSIYLDWTEQPSCEDFRV